MKTVKKWLNLAGACICAVGVTANARAASYVDTNDSLTAPSYHSTNGVAYATGGGLYQIDSFFDIFTELQRTPPPPPGPPQIDSFFDVFTEISLDIPGLPTLIRESPSKISTASAFAKVDGPTRFFDTEMLSLDLQGGQLPPGVMIRESPTLQSTGKTLIRESPTLPGGYRIDSFFDVFTELSIDGGQTWVPGSGPMHLTSVPEPSSLVMASLSGLALVWVGYRRRYRS